MILRRPAAPAMPSRGNVCIIVVACAAAYAYYHLGAADSIKIAGFVLSYLSGQ